MLRGVATQACGQKGEETAFRAYESREFNCKSEGKTGRTKKKEKRKNKVIWATDEESRGVVLAGLQACWLADREAGRVIDFE